MLKSHQIFSLCMLVTLMRCRRKSKKNSSNVYCVVIDSIGLSFWYICLQMHIKRILMLTCFEIITWHIWVMMRIGRKHTNAWIRSKMNSYCIKNFPWIMFGAPSTYVMPIQVEPVIILHHWNDSASPRYLDSVMAYNHRKVGTILKCL